MARDKRKPYTPLAVVEAAAAEPPPELIGCGGCRHWKRQNLDRIPAVGLCLSLPPAIPSAVTPVGPLCVYPVTEETTPACGRFEAR